MRGSRRWTVRAIVGAGLAALVLYACGSPPPPHDPATTNYVFVGNTPGKAHGEWWRFDGRLINGLTMYCGDLDKMDPVNDHFWHFGEVCTP